MNWIAMFSAMVIGIPIDINDHDQKTFRNKRACLHYVMKVTPRMRTVLADMFPFPMIEIIVKGRCVREGQRV